MIPAGRLSHHLPESLDNEPPAIGARHRKFKNGCLYGRRRGDQLARRTGCRRHIPRRIHVEREPSSSRRFALLNS